MTTTITIMVDLSRARLHRALMSRLLPIAFSPRKSACEQLMRLGTVYGGWWIPIDLLDSSSVVYSVGIGEDASFDLELADKVQCTIHAFDPTPRALAYLESVGSPSIVAHPFGLWAKDEVLRLYEPADPTHVSLSLVDRNATAKYMDLPVRRLSTIMADLGHSDIDLLKMDIEGAEAEVLRDVLNGPIRPRVLAVEFERIEAPWETLSRIRQLKRHGYRPVAVEKNNITFVHAPGLGEGL